MANRKSVPKKTTGNGAIPTPAEHDTKLLSDFVQKANVSEDTKAILKAIELQTQCVINAMYSFVDAIRDE